MVSQKHILILLGIETVTQYASVHLELMNILQVLAQQHGRGIEPTSGSEAYLNSAGASLSSQGRNNILSVSILITHSTGNQCGICIDGITKGETGVLPQPALEFHLKAEALAKVLFKEGPQVLGAYDVGGDGLVKGSGHLAVDRTPLGL